MQIVYTAGKTSSARAKADIRPTLYSNCTLARLARALVVGTMHYIEWLVVCWVEFKTPGVVGLNPNVG